MSVLPELAQVGELRNLLNVLIPERSNLTEPAQSNCNPGQNPYRVVPLKWDHFESLQSLPQLSMEQIINLHFKP